MQRIIGLFVHELIRPHGRRHAGRFQRDANIVKIVFVEQRHMIQRTLHHSFRCRRAVFFQNMLFNRTRVDADANRNVLCPARLRNRLDALFRADIARIDTNGADASLGRGECQPIIKMNIRDDRNRRMRTDGFHRLCGSHIRYRTANNMTACGRQPLNLRQRCLCIARIGIGHRLHGNRCSAADRHISDKNLFCFHTPLPFSHAAPSRRRISCQVT